MKNESNSAAEYVKTMLEINGVSVVTVDDGWVFTFTKEKLLSLLAGNGKAENIMIFVKSSAGQPTN